MLKRWSDCKPAASIIQSDHDLVHSDNRWELWIMSPQYAKAFRTYWNSRGFPKEIYPTWLIKSNGHQLRFEPLHGRHIWMKDDYELFKRSRIYNEQLRIWCHRLLYESYVDVAVRQGNSIIRERRYYPNKDGYYARPLH